ncbi:hypothetical protein FBZ89_14014 [Nitrospirillum amazonense]|uniref:Uncharacterized protein n=1 Tax=Nitrospirillum amazonense TaxID=28077 RepID=A0A560EJW5_9PROT|nr:hypothetical protein [Nitrospirillum amazonense]TWB09669.1 hypothetical protein FBZ89_14014 [Nitrospirillum amazonense]
MNNAMNYAPVVLSKHTQDFDQLKNAIIEDKKEMEATAGGIRNCFEIYIPTIVVVIDANGQSVTFTVTDAIESCTTTS